VGAEEGNEGEGRDGDNELRKDPEPRVSEKSFEEALYKPNAMCGVERNETSGVDKYIGSSCSDCSHDIRRTAQEYRRCREERESLTWTINPARPR
jgi:hypothetical protein